MCVFLELHAATPGQVPSEWKVRSNPVVVLPKEWDEVKRERGLRVYKKASRVSNHRI